jgi:D-alanine-D-alanine ligase
MTKKITVALLSGGISSERKVSIKSGNQVFNALDKIKYNVFRYDPKTDIARLIADAPDIDVALIILHGNYGEDGTVQGMLDLLKIPYQGSGTLGSSIAMNKLASKRLYEHAKIQVPAYLSFQASDVIDTDACIERLGLPLVVKPVTGGSSIGMTIAKSKRKFTEAIKKAFTYDDTILIEEYIKGIEITGGVMGNHAIESLPIVEIVPNKKHEFFDYEAKYLKGESLEICPARISQDLAQKAKDLAVKSHRALFCKGYSRTDMMIRGDDLFVLETNTIPGMTPVSLLPLAAKTAGMGFSQLLDRLIELALEQHKKIKKSGRSCIGLHK